MSEYVTNAVVHSGSPDITLLLIRRGRTLIVVVRDHGRWRTPRPRPADAEHGRGLLLVDTYARLSARHRTSAGTHAWAQLVLPSPVGPRPPRE